MPKSPAARPSARSPRKSAESLASSRPPGSPLATSPPRWLPASLLPRPVPSRPPRCRPAPRLLRAPPSAGRPLPHAHARGGMPVPTPKSWLLLAAALLLLRASAGPAPMPGYRRRHDIADRLRSGMPPDKEAGKKRREKYFLTNCCELIRAIYGSRSPTAPQGFWQGRRELGIRDESNPSRFAGIKRTYDFHTGYRLGGGTKTNWVMNVYLLIGQDRYIQNQVALCHVFENNSPDYDPRPKCAACDQPPNGKGSLSSTYPCSYQHSGKPCNQAIHGPSSSSSLSTNPVSNQTLQPELTSYQEELCSNSSLPTHPVSDQTLHPEVTSYIEELENLLLGEPDTSTGTGSYDARGGGPRSAVIASGENVQSRKRTRTSSVWERFTRIFAHDPDGVKVFAVCNHCCKVLTGDSKKGTSHLARHKCQCNHGSSLPTIRSPHPPRALADGQRMRGPLAEAPP